MLSSLSSRRRRRFSPVTPRCLAASSYVFRNCFSVMPYVNRAFCFSCSCTRNSEFWLRLRPRPCSPGGYGRFSRALVSPAVPQTFIPNRRETRALGPVYRDMCQTLRRLGGRHPLCGTGVISLMPVTSIPAFWIERIAVSRPDPGPLTCTSTRRTPCSMALRAASSAACCAANGVDFREPLNPTLPAEAQETTFPFWSLKLIMVLLHEL